MNKPVTTRLLLTLVILYCPTLIAVAKDNQLQRRAFIGISEGLPSNSKPGILVTGVIPDSTAAKAQLQPGDIIIQIDGITMRDMVTYAKTVRSWRAGQTINLLISRNGTFFERQVVAVPFPKESLEGIDVSYESVLSDYGHRLRTIVTRPEGAAGPLPAVLFVQWLSCSSIELSLPYSLIGMRGMLHGIAKSGFVLMRVEKPGVGDSQGPDCSESDFQTDMAAFRAALKQLKKYDFVDQNAIFIFGASMGGAMAPLIAEGENIGGIIVTGTHVKTWYEHMIEFERRRLELLGRAPSEVYDKMRDYSEFYTMFLIQKLSPAEILRQKPYLRSVWQGQPYHQFGRPAAFYHQAQEANVAAAWEKVKAPVLVIYGEYDWIMSRDDHELIVKIVNGKNPGRASFIQHPKMDHNFLIFEGKQDAFSGQSTKFDESLLKVTVNWLRSNLRTDQ